MKIVVPALLLILVVVAGAFWWWPGPASPTVDSGKPSIIDQLIAEAEAPGEVKLQGREAIAMDTSLPNRNTPPLISFSSLQGDSHQKMLTALAKIRDLNRFEAGFFGDKDLANQERELQQVPEDKIQDRYNRMMDLGMRHLWLGNIDQSIQHYLDAYHLVTEHQSEVPQQAITGAAYQVALAYLRKGETENCVQCNNGESCLVPIQSKGRHQFETGSTQALKFLEIVLRDKPDHVSARWLYNVASMTLGRYPDQVPEAWRIPPERFQSHVEFPRFANIATGLGLATVNLSGGTVWDDFDNDGDLDLLTSSWGLGDSLHYFRNDRAEGFVDLTVQANLSGLLGGLNMIQADYDNDGDLDVLILRGAWSQEDGRIPNSLLQNDGQGRFVDVTFDVGLADDNYPTQTAVWFDLENDGDLDLFIGNEKYPCQLFENNQGRFTDIAQGEATRNFRFTKAVVAADVNRDGFVDLFLSNHGQKNRLLINNQDKGFVDEAEAYHVQLPLLSFPAWFWDYNNDGWTDLFVSGYSYGQAFVSETYFRQPSGKETMRLYQGGPDGFRDVTQDVQLDRVVQPMGSNFGDLDNDGFLDIYLGTGCPEYDTLMPNLMFHNRDGQTFDDVTTAGGFGHLQKGHGVAFADIDNDGDQDIFAQMGGAYPGDQAANALYQNPTENQHWLRLLLVGKTSNRSALGAHIAVTVTTADQQTRTIHRWVGSGGSFGAGPLRQEIGLGDADKLIDVKVTWPATGKTVTYQQISLDQAYTLHEDQDSPLPTMHAEAFALPVKENPAKK